MIVAPRLSGVARNVGRLTLCMSLPLAHVYAFAPPAFPSSVGLGGERFASPHHGVNFHQKTVFSKDKPRPSMWHQATLRTKRSLRMSEEAAGAEAISVEHSAPIQIPTPLLDTYTSVVHGEPQTEEGSLVETKPTGIKPWFENVATKMTVPQATVLLVLVVALTGVAFPLVKFVSTSFDSSAILAGRFLIATLCLLPWLQVNRKLLIAGTETGAWLAAGFMAQALSLSSGTSAGVCSFFASMSCIVCPFLEAWTGVRLTPRTWLASALAVTGTAFLCLGNGALPSAGDMIGLLQPLLFGIYLFRTERRMADNPGKAMEITAVQSALVCAIAGAVGTAQAVLAGASLPAFSELSTMAGAGILALSSCLPQLAGLVFMGVLSSAFVIAAQTMVVAKLSSSKTSLMFATEPLFAAAIAFLLLGEGLGLNMVVGGSLAVVACVTASSDSFYSKLTRMAAGVKRLATGTRARRGVSAQVGKEAGAGGEA